MSQGSNALSEREKETLRLLLDGHDAKSIARRLDLSVHTINERLRDSRRKLGVTSSREAARVLAKTERHTPDPLVPDHFGVARTKADAAGDERSDQHQSGARALFWLGGGMLIMSLIIAAATLAPTILGTSPPAAAPTSTAIPGVMTPDTTPSPATNAAGNWVLLLDKQQWDASWVAAGTLFRSQMSETRWATTIQPLRQSLGPVSSRVVQSATKTTSLPGVPPGQYELVEFKTDFAQKRGAIETVVLSREGPAWKVNGYFIR